MRRSLPAFLVSASLLLSAPTARAADCTELKLAYDRAEKAVHATIDEIGAMELAKPYYSRAASALDDTPQQLAGELRTADMIIRLSKVTRDDPKAEFMSRRYARQRIMLLEKWTDILREFLTIRSTGGTIDPRDNALLRWRQRVERRLPRLRAELPNLQAAAWAALRAHMACEKGEAAPEAAIGPEKLFNTNIGEARVTIGPGSVTGSYKVNRGPRLANGPMNPSDIRYTVGRIRGTRSGAVVEGYWYEQGDRFACAKPREGFKTWGRFRWELRFGGWTGFRGDCDQDMTATWDGWPAR